MREILVHEDRGNQGVLTARDIVHKRSRESRSINRKRYCP